MDKARRAWLKIIYNKKDISSDIAPYLKSFSYNDVMSGEADDVSITLEDVNELWQGDWLPDKGDTLTVSIITLNWEQDNTGEKELPLGMFEIDELEISRPPSEVKIKAVSVPDSSELRGVDKSRSWEKTELSVIAQDIADSAGLEFNEEAKTIADAEKLAKKKLREKNKEEITVDINLRGDFDLLAGNTVMLNGFHSFDGKYIITKSGHDIGGGYKMKLDLKRCLDGY